MLSGICGAPGGGTSVGSRRRRGTLSSRSGTGVGRSSSVSRAVRVTGAPTATVPGLASTLTTGAALVYSSSTPRPNCVRAFDVMVLTSISHSGCSQP